MAKHVAVAYLLWLVGFWMGLHHLYLNRPRSAFLLTVTLNVGGVGWWRDLLMIPEYVHEANMDREFVAKKGIEQRFHERPPIAWLVFFIQLAMGQLFGAIASSLVPKGVPGGCCEVLYILGASWGIVFSGQALELQVKSSWRRVCAAIAAVLVPAYLHTKGDVEDPLYKNAKTTALMLGCVMFWYAREWSVKYEEEDRRTHDTASELVQRAGNADTSSKGEHVASAKKNASWWRTLVVYYALLGAFTLAAATAMFFHGEITVTIDGQSRTHSFPEAAENVFRSDAFFDGLGDLFSELFGGFDGNSFKRDEHRFSGDQEWRSSQHQRSESFEDRWHKFQSKIDISGKHRYLKVLGLEKNASLADIKRAYKRLALQWHPDKYAGEDAVHAQKMFYRIQEAYEKLQKLTSAKAGKQQRSDEL